MNLEHIRSICIGIATGLLVDLLWYFIWVLYLNLILFLRPLLLSIIVVLSCVFVRYIAYKFLKNTTSGIIYGYTAGWVSLAVTMVLLFLLHVLNVPISLVDDKMFMTVYVLIKIILFPFLGFFGGYKAELLMLERLKVAGLVSEEAYKRVLEELAGDPIFKLKDRYFVTICTREPERAVKWRELITYLHQNSKGVKVMMHASYRQDGSLREAYLTAITASYIYIIGKFINTVTSELELQTTLSLIKQLGIPVEVREEGDPSYSQIRELFEYAVTHPLPKYTIEEVKNIQYLSEE